MKLLLLIRILWEANISVSSAYATTESPFVIIWFTLKIYHYQIICQRYRLDVNQITSIFPASLTVSFPQVNLLDKKVIFLSLLFHPCRAFSEPRRVVFSWTRNHKGLSLRMIKHLNSPPSERKRGCFFFIETSSRDNDNMCVADHPERREKLKTVYTIHSCILDVFRICNVDKGFCSV